MRSRQVYGNRRRESAVSLNRLGVKSSSEQLREPRKRRKKEVHKLVAAAGSEIRRQQMAGESGERKRLPERQPHGRGEEKPTGNVSENDPQTHKECRGKENHAGKLKPVVVDKVLDEDTEQTDPSIFFDEDSNHIYPVEQFFGNLNTVQDFSCKATATHNHMSRREYRRLHYYAKEDSDEEQT